MLPAAEGNNIDPTKTLNCGTTREPALFQFRVRTLACSLDSRLER
jgi:hypothetical protein